MAFDISKLKSISNSTLSTLAEKDTKTSYRDDRFWKLSIDANGNGKAIIRFLPSIREGELPWTEQWSYAIKGPGGWYIENSLKTIGKADPMAEYISQRWNEAVTETDKQNLRSAGLSKARHQYIANILVLNDPEHPENNGKIFLYRFGQKIYEMITEMAKPDAFDETKGGINVTDWDTGCNFRLIATTKERFLSYDKSYFEDPSSIGGDQQIIAIADKMYDLGEFTDPTKLKSYEQLKERRDRVLNIGSGSSETFESAPRGAGVSIAPTAQSTITPVQPVMPAVAQPIATTAVATAPWETSVSDDMDIDFEALMQDVKS